jgi:hypothetical protein
MRTIYKFVTYLWLSLFFCSIARADMRVFSATGQSNNAAYSADGFGPAVTSGKVLKYQGGTISDANDPVGMGPIGGTPGGSLWPAFLQRIYQSSGQKVGIINTSMGGSSLLAAANSGFGFWEVAVTGNLYIPAKATIQAGLAAFIALDPSATYAGNIDGHGETDAGAIDNGTVTEVQWIAAKRAEIAQWRADFGDPTRPWYFIRLGTGAAGAGTTGWQQIRAAQEEICATDPYSLILFRGADTFFSRGLMQPSSLHYTQAGYNEIGWTAAHNLLTGSFSPAYPEVMLKSPSLPYDALVMRSALAYGFLPTNFVSIVNENNWRAVTIQGIGTWGAGIEFVPQGTGSRAKAIWSAGPSNVSGTVPGKFVIWDELSGIQASW